MTTLDAEKTTPMMMQWHECKLRAKDAILLFRLGDFYEAFYDDAATMASLLELTLTKRQEIPMAGVPCHTVESYIDRLVAKGYRVAIAEQMEDPKNVKGIVKREVVRVVSRGTVITSSLLSEKANNYFVCLTQVGKIFALCHLDLTTAEFKATEFSSKEELLNELCRLDPAECLVPGSFAAKHPSFVSELKRLPKCMITEGNDWYFEHKHAHNFLIEHFQVHSLDGYGLKGMTGAINAAGALLRQLKEGLNLPVGHLRDISTYSTEHYLNIDRLTERHLELCTPLFETTSKGSTLLATLDKTKTPMGARLLRSWILRPRLVLY